MASAQVLPSSRKQEHLAAGKRRETLSRVQLHLEEFRKKKAAKKTSSSNITNVTQSEQQPSDTHHAFLPNSDGAIQQLSISGINDQLFDISQRNEQDSAFPINDTTNAFAGSAVHIHAKNKEYNRSNEVSRSNTPVDYNINQEIVETNDDSGIFRGSSYGFISVLDSKRNEETLGIENRSNLKHFTFKNPESSLNPVVNNVNSQPRQAKSTNMSTPPWGDTGVAFIQEVNQPSSTNGFSLESELAMCDVAISDGSEKPNIEKRTYGSSSNVLIGVQSLAPYTSTLYSSTVYSSDISKSSDHTSLYPPIDQSQPQQSRPSFLDSLNMPRASPVFPYEYAELKESILGNDTGNHMVSLGKLPFGTQYTEYLATSATVNGERGLENKQEFYLPEQDEGFAALEQHIEDLTQEKFSLQRALEASKVLAESLASENSSLTDSYNQQRSAFNQLKADMEKLQEEISRQLAELEFLKHEYANAQLECNAADERAKSLASEVIGLEEKALLLRSSELKLERQLENSQAEIAAYKKKVATLEKERLDLQSTVNAFQEEKRILQSKLQKSSSGGRSVEVGLKSANKKDMSTSTNDLDTSIGTSAQQMEHTHHVVEDDVFSSLFLSETSQLNVEASFAYIPQLQMVDNINTLISELALEKEELVKALASKTSDNSKLKDLNKEMSRKLEAQTQRLEFLTAQSMANDGMPAKQIDPGRVLDNTAYADEGDEVVERVLGWIMKLFPGGPSRRRTSKLL